MNITPLSDAHFADVITLANRIHGDNYLNALSLKDMYTKGIKNNINASFVALNSQGKVIGYRISFACGTWALDKWCSTALWGVAPNYMAYFKSVGIAKGERGKGVASSLLMASISALKQQGAKAGIAHIWYESPNSEAQRYFEKAGASVIAKHPDRWRHLSETAGYYCPRCGNDCRCSALEMQLVF